MQDQKREIGWLLTEKYLGIETEAFKADLERLKHGEPLAYLIGHVPFLDAIVYLDSRPQIPRSETEYWVERAIHEIRESGKSDALILDLCAGSGCVGVSVLRAFPDVMVHFGEIDEVHHRTIKKNLLENNIDLARTKIFGGDLFEEMTGVYDFILANPPYIDRELDRTEESVRRYEPHAALYADAHGLSCITKIIQNAGEHLAKDGVIYIEHEPEHAEAIRELGVKAAFEVRVCKDQFGIVRFTRLCRVLK